MVWQLFFGYDTKSKGASQVALMVKNTPANGGDIGHAGSISGLGRSLGERIGLPTPVFLDLHTGEHQWTEEPSRLQSMAS